MNPAPPVTKNLRPAIWSISELLLNCDFLGRRSFANAQNSRGYTCSYCIVGNVGSHDSARSHNRVHPDPDTWQDRSVGTNVGAVTNHYRLDYKAGGNNRNINRMSRMLRTQHLGPGSPANVVFQNEITGIEVGVWTNPDVIPNLALPVIATLDHGMRADKDGIAKLHGLGMFKYHFGIDL